MAIEDNTLYGLTGAQIKELPGKIEAIKGLAKDLTTDDYDYPTANPDGIALWKLPYGWYSISYNQNGLKVYPYASNNSGEIVYQGLISTCQTQNKVLIGKWVTDLSNFGASFRRTDYDGSPVDNTWNNFSLLGNTSIVDNLTSTSSGKVLSAKQGKVLKDLIDGLVISGTGAPTTSTVGTKGKLYEDATNGKLYQCTNVSGSTYTWTEITKTSIYSATGRGGTGGLITEDLAGLFLAGKPESGLPYALMTNNGGGEYDWSYVRGVQDNSTGIRSAYIGSYAYDYQEDWWSGKHESQLALYSDLDGRVKQNAGAPTTSTVGSKGQLLEDTTNGNLYQCTNVSGNTYTWKRILAGAGGTRRASTTGWKTDGTLDYISGVQGSSNQASGALFYTGDDLSDFPVYAGIGIYAAETSAAYTPYLLTKSTDDDGTGTITGYTCNEDRLALYDDVDNRIKTNAGAPTTSTVGTKGQLLEDTTNGKVYICTAVNGNTYTWEEVGSGGGSSVTKTSDLTNDGSDGTSTYVEADELASVATSGSYNDLSNKPTIPTVNDSTITITNNGTTVDSFTTNASSNKTIALSSPVITMTTTDPGEGAALAANNFIAVYSV